MTMELISKPSLRTTLIAMEPEQTVVFDFGIWQQNSIRNCACNVGLDFGRKYTIRMDREEKKFYITRLS